MVLELITFSVYLFGLINVAFNRRSVISMILFLAMLMIIMGGNTTNPDSLNYEYFYNGLFTDSVEPGFRLLMSFGHILHLDYKQFRLFICVIALFLMWIGIQRMVSTLSYKVYILYFIYPFFIDIIQLRNFIMMSILVLATSFLKKKSMRNELIFITLTGIGATIQILGAVYLSVILLYQFDKQDKWKKIILILTATITIASVTPFVQNLLSFIIADNTVGIFDKMSNYSISIVRHGYYIFWIADYLLLGCVIYLRKHTSEKNDFVKYQLQTAIYSVIVLTTFFLPLYTIDLSFDRAFRNIIPLIIVEELLSFSMLKDKKGEKFAKNIILILTILALTTLFWIDIVPLFGVSYDPFHGNWLIN